MSVEVEDIMCDQCIIFEDSFMSLSHKKSYMVLPVSKIWVAIDILIQALLPTVSTIYSSVLRNPQTVMENLKNQFVPAIAAFLANSLSKSLASVQKISLRAVRNCDNYETNFFEEMEKCVDCKVLFQPENIKADVVFIHGIHGGVDKTWKQGTWRKINHKLSRQMPVKKDASENLYVPSHRSLKRTLSKIYSKIPNKIARREEEACIIGNWKMDDENDDCDENVKNYSQCWPKDWIPEDCSNARVIALNYSTDILWYPLWAKKRPRTDLVARSQEMIKELLKLGVGSKPIIWVGHSKGGLYIKQIILNAWKNPEDSPEIKNLFWQSKSIMWYSVPHKGSILADFSLPILKRSIELLEVQRNCDFVLNLHKEFLEVVEISGLNPEVFSFIETSFTLMSFVYLKIVAYDSADPNIGIKCDVPLDHREICKPAGRDCFLYTELMKMINKRILEQTIKDR